MTEIYTKPFESVQAAITLFEQKIDPKRCSTSSNKEEKGGFLKELSDCSLLLEAKELEKDLAFFEFDASSKSHEELLTLLKLYKAERDNYKEKFRKSQALFLEYEYEQMKQVNSESENYILEAEVEGEGMKEELNISSEKINGMNCMIEMKQVNSESENYILEVEEEGEGMKEELNISSEKINGMNCMIEMLVGEIQSMQEEMSKNKNKEFEFQPNVTTLTSELHNQAMLQLVVKAEEAKTEAQRLAKYIKAETEDEEGGSNKNSAFIDADSNGFCTGVTISMEEYEFLILKAEQADGTRSEPADESEVNKLKRELEDKNAEIIELTCRLEEIEKRAELSEKAKLAVESQLRKWRDQRQMRRAASDAVKEYCATKKEVDKQQEKPLLSRLACINPEPHVILPHPKRSVSMHDGRKSKHIPLGKLLKIKFRSSS